VLVISFATRYGLGLDAPWYVAELSAIHCVSIPTFLTVPPRHEYGISAVAGVTSATASNRASL